MKKRKDGRYLKQVLIGYTDEGKPRYKNIYGTTKSDVEQRAALFKAEFERGVAVTDENLTFGIWADKWLDTYKKNVSFNTFSMYKNVIEKHLKPALGTAKIKNIKKHHLQEILNDLISENKNSTARQVRLTLKQIFSQAQENEYIYKNPALNIQIPKTDKPKKRALTTDEIYLFTNADLEPDEKAFIFLILYCGIRRGEALSLTVSDIDFNNRKISVNKNLIFKGNDPEIKLSPKTDAGIRTLPIVDNLFDVLTEYLTDKTEYLFTMKNGKIMSKSSFRKFWDRIIDKTKNFADSTKKSIGDDVTPHIFRHTYATNLYHAGIDIKTAQYLLGHSSIQVTLDIYTHLENENISNTQDVLNKYFSQKSVN